MKWWKKSPGIVVRDLAIKRLKKANHELAMRAWRAESELVQERRSSGQGDTSTKENR